jgi:trehalose synthase
VPEGAPAGVAGQGLAARLEEVRVAPLSPARFREVLDEQQLEAFEAMLAKATQLLDGRVVWNVNSTPAGGGVAEMLRSFVAYSRGAGLDVRWAVIKGEPEFFRLTKRIHNLLHGHDGDGGPLGENEKTLYEAVAKENAVALAAVVGPRDAVLLHDPQTAGLAPRLKGSGAAVLWRSHVGAEHPNANVMHAWEFLRRYVEHADVCVFTRHAYVPPWAESVRTEIIQPSIDAFSPKNQDLDEETIEAILSYVGLVVGDAGSERSRSFTRQDGSPGRVDRMCEVISTGPPPAFDAPLVVQVSRWDRLKDPRGVMLGFAEHVVEGTDAHLILAGPTVHSVADDPEAAEVLDEVEATWRKLAHGKRSRVHLACLPMLDVDENAAIVNALQRHATVVVQKSLEEGFGLTVAEAMWKARPVLASAVGGIQDQIIDGETGVLIEDPSDLRAFGEATLALLGDPERRRRIGAAGREHVRQHFLVNRHAAQYIRLLSDILH